MSIVRCSVTNETCFLQHSLVNSHWKASNYNSRWNNTAEKRFKSILWVDWWLYDDRPALVLVVLPSISTSDISSLSASLSSERARNRWFTAAFPCQTTRVDLTTFVSLNFTTSTCVFFPAFYLYFSTITGYSISIDYAIDQRLRQNNAFSSVASIVAPILKETVFNISLFSHTKYT